MNFFGILGANLRNLEFFGKNLGDLGNLKNFLGDFCKIWEFLGEIYKKREFFCKICFFKGKMWYNLAKIRIKNDGRDPKKPRFRGAS